MCQTADCGLPDGHTKLKVGLLALRYSLPGGAPLSPPYLRELPCLPCLVLPCLTLPCPALLPCAPPPPPTRSPTATEGDRPPSRLLSFGDRWVLRAFLIVSVPVRPPLEPSHRPPQRRAIAKEPDDKTRDEMC